MSLLDKAKTALAINNDDENSLLSGFIESAVTYAETYNHVSKGTYALGELSPNVEQAVILLVSYYYDFKDLWTKADSLLRLNRPKV